MPSLTYKKWWRDYIDGYDMSGYTRTLGPLTKTYAEVGAEPNFSDPIIGMLPGHATITVGDLNAALDTTTDGLHDHFTGSGVRTVMVALGIEAAPIIGVPVFAGEFEQMSYKGEVSEDAVISMAFAPSARDVTRLYDNPWGWLLHPKGAETAVNTGTSDHDHGASTAFGGFMCYQLFTSDGTVTIKVQDAATDSDLSFGDLASSGVIDASVTPAAAIVALGKTATVEQYTRWQIVLGTATTATFALSFHRAIA